MPATMTPARRAAAVIQRYTRTAERFGDETNLQQKQDYCDALAAMSVAVTVLDDDGLTLASSLVDVAETIIEQFPVDAAALCRIADTVAKMERKMV